MMLDESIVGRPTDHSANSQISWVKIMMLE